MAQKQLRAGGTRGLTGVFVSCTQVQDQMKGMNVDINKLSAAKLEALYAKRQAACSVNCSALINAGRGMERGNEIYAKGKANADALSIEYVTLTDATQQVIFEMEARKRYHGTLKPIKRKEW